MDQIRQWIKIKRFYALSFFDFNKFFNLFAFRIELYINAKKQHNKKQKYMNEQNFHEKVKHYIHLDYHERMKYNEELFSSAKTKPELTELYYLFSNYGVHDYEERLLILLMGKANTESDWEFLKFHGMYYHGIHQTAINALKQLQESVNWLFFSLWKMIKKFNWFFQPLTYTV